MTSSPARGLEATLRLTERLAKRGYAVVPHLAARLIADRDELRRILLRLDDAGVRDAFVVAGDSEEPTGDFPDALALLQAMSAAGHGLEEVGVAGYPETHPLIANERMTRALLDKAPLATYVVSQVCFDAAAIAGWIARVRRLGVGLPVFVGIPGIVERRRLLRIATRIGVGESLGFLRKHRTWVARLLLPAPYRPDRLLDDLGRSLEDPAAGVHGLHLYTLNAVARTESWRRARLAL